jgi:hypothetical protein
MPVPETPMNEDGCFVFFENDIGLAWKPSHVKTEPITGRMQELSQMDFRARIRAPDSRHVPTAVFL